MLGCVWIIHPLAEFTTHVENSSEKSMKQYASSSLACLFGLKYFSEFRLLQYSKARWPPDADKSAASGAKQS